MSAAPSGRIDTEELSSQIDRLMDNIAKTKRRVDFYSSVLRRLVHSARASEEQILAASRLKERYAEKLRAQQAALWILRRTLLELQTGIAPSSTKSTD